MVERSSQWSPVPLSEFLATLARPIPISFSPSNPMAAAKLSTASRRCNVSFIDFAATRGNYTAHGCMHALARLVSPRLVSSRLLSSRFDSVRALAARLTDCWLGKHAVIPDNDNDNIAFSTILVPRSFGRFRFRGSRERLMRKHRGNR